MKLHLSIILTTLLLIYIPIYAQVYKSTGHVVAGQLNCSAATDTSHLNEPWNVWLGTGGSVFVTDFNNNRVQKWAPGAKAGITVAGQANGNSGSDSSHFFYPEGLFVGMGDTVYVADYGNNRVQKWAPGATFGVTVAGDPHGAHGTDSNLLYLPSGVFLDRTGNLFVCDFYNNRVQKFAPGSHKGITVAGKHDGTHGSDSASLSEPQNIFVDPAGNVYVVDAGNARIQKWAPGAKYGVTVAGQKNGYPGHDSTHLNAPQGVWVDSFNNVYVADQSNRIVLWAPGAKYGVSVIGKAPYSGSCDTTSVHGPEGLFMDRAGALFIAEALSNKVTKWDLKYGSHTNDLNAASIDLKIYPNPSVDGQFTLDITTPNIADKAYIQVLNMVGQVMHQQMVYNNNGYIHTILSASNMPAGVYLVKISIGGASVMQRVVIVN